MEKRTNEGVRFAMRKITLWILCAVTLAAVSAAVASDDSTCDPKKDAACASTNRQASGPSSPLDRYLGLDATDSDHPARSLLEDRQQEELGRDAHWRLDPEKLLP